MPKIFNQSGKLITDDLIARALGLSPEEYQQLIHSELMEVADLDGNTRKYFLVIGNASPPDILNKLRLNMFNMVYINESDLGM